LPDLAKQDAMAPKNQVNMLIVNMLHARRDSLTRWLSGPVLKFIGQSFISVYFHGR